MKKFDELFKKEQEKIEIKKQLADNEEQAKKDIIIKFCNEGLFDFLEYLHNKFYVIKHGMNHHVDRAVYQYDMVYHFTNKESGIKNIQNDGYLRTGIQYKWSNGGIYDTLIVKCVDFKPVLEYEGVKMDLDTFMETVVAQIQGAINKNSDSFKILTKK